MEWQHMELHQKRKTVPRQECKPNVNIWRSSYVVAWYTAINTGCGPPWSASPLYTYYTWWGGEKELNWQDVFWVRLQDVLLCDSSEKRNPFRLPQKGGSIFGRQHIFILQCLLSQTLSLTFHAQLAKSLCQSSTRGTAHIIVRDHALKYFVVPMHIKEFLALCCVSLTAQS